MVLFVNRQTPKAIWGQRNLGKRIWVNRQFAHQHEVAVTLPHGLVSPVLSSSFVPSDWANPLIRKRVIVASGTEIGASNVSYAIALSSWAEGSAGNFAGELILDNYGTISGIGGTPALGVGGTVINVPYSGRNGEKFIVNNYGTLRAGGGPGGTGGQGGPGVWYSGRTVTEGPHYTLDYYCFIAGSGQVYWAGVNKGYIGNGGSDGTWNYYQGAFAESQNFASYYYVYRQRVIYDVPNYTTGGAGGIGGRGQGYDGGNAGGQAGAAGGTNAGAGGTGGWGNHYGGAGTGYEPGYGIPGNAGAAGNAGAGQPGLAGGPPGYYLQGSANTILNNYGTVLGRVA